jgi:putative iron-regulated protein
MNFGRKLTACCIAIFLIGCGGGDDDTENTESDPARAEAVQTYSRIVHESYSDALATARDLESSIGAFIDDPTAETLSDAREAWLAAREPYLQTEVYRFYDGPIDNPDDGPEGMINAWPLDEAYIDYVEGDPEAGIVNDPSQTIDAESLAALNEQGGEENIATGYHAIEFLLWGQDLDDEGPGARPASDYVDTANADRRALYLTTVAAMLVEHLEGLVDAWAPDVSDNYRAELEGAEPDEGLRRIFTGMIVLSGFETGGERLQTALDSGDQEDEHSCFSDNTHRDMVQDVQGVMNVWQGSYTALDGSSVAGRSIREVVASVDAALADELAQDIEQSLSLANELVPPFDREIAPENESGRARVEALVTALRKQARTLEDVFTTFGLTVPPME